MGRNPKDNPYREDSGPKNGTRSQKKQAKRSSRHNTKIMIDKVNHGLVDSTDLDEYLEFDSYDD
jgi:hypothetical protein